MGMQTNNVDCCVRRKQIYKSGPLVNKIVDDKLI